MKLSICIPLVIIVVSLAAWSATAHESYVGKGRDGSRHLSMLKEELNLTDEQVIAVQEVFADRKKVMADIIAEHGLKKQDLRNMRHQLRKFHQQGRKKLAGMLNNEQQRALRENIFQNEPMKFMELSTEEKLARLQIDLGLNVEEAGAVLDVLAEGRAYHDDVLIDAGLDLAQIQAFQQDMASQREDMKHNLANVLSEEQMVLFRELRRGDMQQRGCGPRGLSFMVQ